MKRFSPFLLPFLFLGIAGCVRAGPEGPLEGTFGDGLRLVLETRDLDNGAPVDRFSMTYGLVGVADELWGGTAFFEVTKEPLSLQFPTYVNAGGSVAHEVECSLRLENGTCDPELMSIAWIHGGTLGLGVSAAEARGLQSQTPRDFLISEWVDSAIRIPTAIQVYSNSDGSEAVRVEGEPPAPDESEPARSISPFFSPLGEFSYAKGSDVPLHARPTGFVLRNDAWVPLPTNAALLLEIQGPKTRAQPESSMIPLGGAWFSGWPSEWKGNLSGLGPAPAEFYRFAAANDSGTAAFLQSEPFAFLCSFVLAPAGSASTQIPGVVETDRQTAIEFDFTLCGHESRRQVIVRALESDSLLMGPSQRFEVINSTSLPAHPSLREPPSHASMEFLTEGIEGVFLGVGSQPWEFRMVAADGGLFVQATALPKRYQSEFSEPGSHGAPGHVMTFDFTTGLPMFSTLPKGTVEKLLMDHET